MSLRTKDKDSLAELVCQAQEAIREQVLNMLRSTLEEMFERLRDVEVKRARYERCEPMLYRYGYTVRKVVETLWGTISGLRVPRVRGPEGEVRLFARHERRLQILAEQLVMGFGQGMSLRSLSVWLTGLGLPSACAPALADVIHDKVDELNARRSGHIPGNLYRALVVDGVWGRKRRGKKQVLLVAIGVRDDGGFEVLDWNAAASENAPGYEKLLTRLYERGLENVELIVADESGAIASAIEMVYPYALRQVCLYHLQRTLELKLRDRRWIARQRFRRKYWRIFDAETGAEAKRKLGRFCREWEKNEPEMVSAIKARGESLFHYFRFPEDWRHRIRTTNLGENFFRHFRTFLRRFPGWKNEDHAEQILATYLLSQEEKSRFGRISPYQLQMNFNRGA